MPEEPVYSHSASDNNTKISFDCDAFEALARNSLAGLPNFLRDAERYAVIALAIPEKYARNAVRYAWEAGHSSGYYEVLQVLGDLALIFTEAK